MQILMMLGMRKMLNRGDLGFIFEYFQFDFDSKSVLIRTFSIFSLIRTLSSLSLMSWLFLVCLLLCDADGICYRDVRNDVFVNVF